jgi:hypothetical protein
MFLRISRWSDPSQCYVPVGEYVCQTGGAPPRRSLAVSWATSDWPFGLIWMRFETSLESWSRRCARPSGRGVQSDRLKVRGRESGGIADVREGHSIRHDVVDLWLANTRLAVVCTRCAKGARPPTFPRNHRQASHDQRQPSAERPRACEGCNGAAALVA